MAVGRDAVGEADEVLERGRRGATVGERPAEPGRGVYKRQGGCAVVVCELVRCEEESEPAPRASERATMSCRRSRTLASLSLTSRVLGLVLIEL